MLIFLLVFQTIILCICILSHKMIEKKYKDIEDSMIILNDARAYRTEERICFIKDIVSRYRAYLLVKDNYIEEKNIDLNTMIQGDLLKSRVGKFTFIGVYNIATKIKIIMRYSVLLEILILYVNNELKSYQGAVILTIGIGLALLTESIVILKALDKNQDRLVLSIVEYILYKYPMELQEIDENKNNKKESSNIVDDNFNNQVFTQDKLEFDEKNNEKVYHPNKNHNIKKNTSSDKKNIYKIDNRFEKTITDSDIANVIRSINMSKNKQNNAGISD